MDETTDLLSAPVTEARLHAALGGAPGYWRQFLINSRRPERRQRARIQFETICGRPFYREESVQAFIDLERERRSVFTGTFSAADDGTRAPGIVKGETFDIQARCICDSRGDQPFIEVHVQGNPRVYRLTPEHARRVGKLLENVALAAEQLGDRSE